MIRIALLAAAATVLTAADAPAPRWDAASTRNPLLPGYFADPSIVHDEGRWYIFATIDPWGDDRLALWTSINGRDWRFSTPAWPTKAAASSPSSGDSKVWAPSVVKTRDGRWFMYVSVGSEIWVGTAPSPAGPWRDAHGGKPLVAKAFDPRYHMIDAEAFIDDDGQVYLYWGSGLNWTNGHCFVVKLKPDMVTFDGTPKDVTPPQYFEAPFMVRAGKHYVLTYSDGKTTEDTYKVRYAIGDTPFGPFREAANSPILSTDRARDVISPGHHAIFRSNGQAYILYHRQGLPFPQAGDAVLRQVAVDPLTIHDDGTIATVLPGQGGAVAGFAARRDAGLRWTARGAGADALHGPVRAADDNYATLWRPRPGGPAMLVADLGTTRTVRESLVRMEYPIRRYALSIEASADGRTWRRVAQTTASGSPIVLHHAAPTRYLRLTVPSGAGVWEWTIR
jgi:beta-xylosidase